MKKILVMPVKNEEWIIEKTLRAALLWADHIIIADQGSTDKTIEICEKFSNVIIINNELTSYNEGKRNQLLLNAARQFDGNNLIFALDADEVLSSNFICSDVQNELMSLARPALSIQFPWIQLWKNIHTYNVAPRWKGDLKPFVYCDDRKLKFDDHLIHCPRVPKDTLSNSIVMENIKTLHFQFVDWQRMLSKQDFYIVTERINLPNKSVYLINQRYFSSKNSEEVLKEADPLWLKNYQNINFEVNNNEKYYWYDVEVLKNFESYGLAHFKWLDIWNRNWENLENLILSDDSAKFRRMDIKDPRNILIKFYHKHLLSLLSKQDLLIKIYRGLKSLLSLKMEKSINFKELFKDYIIQNLFLYRIYLSVSIFLNKNKNSGLSKMYIKNKLPRASTILEIGASHGSDTVEMSVLWPKAKIIAFEPIPDVFKRLQFKAKKFNNIELINAAIVDSKIDKIEMNVSSNYGCSSSILEPAYHLTYHPDILFTEKIFANSIFLPDFLKRKNINIVDLLWIDVQGMELRIFKSIEGYLPQIRMIYTEVSLKEIYKGQSLYDELKEYLYIFGFEEDRSDSVDGEIMFNVLFINKNLSK